MSKILKILMYKTSINSIQENSLYHSKYGFKEYINHTHNNQISGSYNKRMSRTILHLDYV